jgi:hypothetical protein
LRSPVDVAHRIARQVPLELKGQFEDLAVNDLAWYIRDFACKPPEQWITCFANLQDYCWSHLWNESGYLPEEWQQKVAAIISDRTLEEVKRLNAEEYKHRVKYDLKKKAKNEDYNSWKR